MDLSLLLDESLRKAMRSRFSKEMNMITPPEKAEPEPEQPQIYGDEQTMSEVHPGADFGDLTYRQPRLVGDWEAYPQRSIQELDDYYRQNPLPYQETFAPKVDDIDMDPLINL